MHTDDEHQVHRSGQAKHAAQAKAIKQTACYQRHQRTGCRAGGQNEGSAKGAHTGGVELGRIDPDRGVEQQHKELEGGPGNQQHHNALGGKANRQRCQAGADGAGGQYPFARKVKAQRRGRNRAQQAAALHHHREQQALGHAVAQAHQNRWHQGQHRDLRAIGHPDGDAQRHGAAAQRAPENLGDAHLDLGRRGAAAVIADIGVAGLRSARQLARCQARQHRIGLGNAALRQQKTRRLGDIAAVERSQQCRHHQADKEPAPAVVAGEDPEHQQAKGRRQKIAQPARAHIDEAHRRAPELGRAELRQHRDRDRNLAPQAKAHHRPAQCHHRQVGRHRADARTNGEQQQVHRQHHAAAIAVGDIARDDAANRRAGKGYRVEHADVRRREPPLLLEHGPDDADRILLEAVKQAANQDQKDDRVVRAGHPYLVQGLVEFGHLGRVGCRGKCRSTSH